MDPSEPEFLFARVSGSFFTDILPINRADAVGRSNWMEAEETVSRAGNILIIHPAGLGDGILALPAIEALKSAWPEARLTLWGYPERWSWLPTGFLQQVHDFQRLPTYRLFTRDGGLPDRWRRFLARQDVIISWYGDAVFAENLRKQSRGRVICRPYRPRELRYHASRFFLESLSPLGIAASLTLPELHPPAEALREARSLMGDIRRPVLVIHPGSGSRKKCWPLNHMAAAANAWMGSVIWLFGPADEEVLADLNKLTPVLPGIKIVNQPLAVAAGILCLGDAFLGNDSGMSHLSAALGRPTVAIFTQTDPDIWKPVGKKVVIFRDHGSRTNALPEVLAALQAFVRGGS